METQINCVVCGNSISRGNFVRCARCGLVQKSPMPTKKQIAALYHEDFDHFAPYIDQLPVHRAYFKQKIPDIIKAYPESGIMNNESWKNKIQKSSFIIHNSSFKLLDIGCAMGALLEEAQKQGIKAVGIDISKDAVAFCRKKGLNVSQTWPKKKFDVVTAFQIIEHERDPLRFMRRIHKLLKTGGIVILATPNYGGWWRKFMGRRWFGFAHPEHVVLLDFNSMRFLLKKAGFRDIKIQRDMPRPFPLSFAFKRAADYFPGFGWFLKPMATLLDRLKLTNPINPWDDMIVYARK